jgi:hypothetical protein
MSVMHLCWDNINGLREKDLYIDEPGGLYMRRHDGSWMQRVHKWDRSRTWRKVNERALPKQLKASLLIMGEL